MSKIETKTWNNYLEYIFGASKSHSSNMNFQTNPESTIGTGKDSPVKFETKVPPIFSRGHGSDEDASLMITHYKRHTGSVSHGEARLA